jgi:hypothetical protein
MAVIAVAFTVACGGGGSRPAPSPTPGPSPTPTPQPAEWSVTGQIVEYGTGALVGGAQLVPGIAASATVDPSGIFRIVGTATPAMFRARIEAPGYLPRETYIRAEAAARNGLAINLIPNRAPFSLNFYRELVRDAAEAPLQPLARLTRNPSIYLRTVDQNGRAIEPEVLDSVSRSVRKAVVDWSSGTLSVAAFERGSATRPRTMGWIMINILRDRESEICGRSFVGRPDGEIELFDDRCACGSTKIGGSLVAHEVGHALGFWHVSDKKAIMAPIGDNCPTGVLTADEKYHAKLAYNCTPGNVDQDIDPDTTPLSMPSGLPGVIVN